MNGILPVNKPVGKTSHDVVNIVRRIFGTRRVGHTGTLDPLASGVLAVCIGNATKASDMITDGDKRYTAELILGMTTDTLDCDGDVLTECPVLCSDSEITDAVMSFVGETEQIPPMYSAIKQNGKKLYELAREGKTVDRKPRKVTIYDIRILEINQPSVIIDVSCSKGTYIRTLCEDIGIKLKCGAYMNSLVRTKSSRFDISDCYSLDEVKELVENGKNPLISVDSLFKNLDEIHLCAKQSERIRNGVFVSAEGISEGEKYRVYDSEGIFLCIAACDSGRLHIVKSFWT